MLKQLIHPISSILKHHSSMATTVTGKSIIGVCQLNVTSQIDENFKQASRLVSDAVKRGAVMCFLPESADFIAANGDQARQLAEENNQEVCERYCGLARTLKVWLSVGLHLFDENSKKTRNSHVIIDDTGVVRSCYDKCHLFDVNIAGKVTLSESRHTKMGDKFIDPTQTPAGKVASMICYDIRFPEISTEMRLRQSEILTYPSAFTVPTGHAHWEVLLRARAIENQCYVVAAAQCGSHNDKRKSFGHSLVVDPWGVVLACAGEQVGVITAEIDLEQVYKLRTSMPVFEHRRTDLY